MGAYEKRKEIEEEIRGILDKSGLTFGDVETILEDLCTDYRRFAYRMDISEVATCRLKTVNRTNVLGKTDRIHYEDPQ